MSQFNQKKASFRYFQAGCYWLAMVAATSHASENNLVQWPTECVGRLQIRFPGAVDVAAMRAGQFINDTGTPHYEFHDGQKASFSRFLYGGSVTVTEPLSSAQSEAIFSALKKKLPRVKSNVARGLIRSGDGSPTTIETLNLPPAKAFGWKVADAQMVSYVAFSALQGHALSWQVSSPPQRSQEFRKSLDKFIVGLRKRTLFTIPPESGVCFPHFFVEDGGDDRSRRLVASTYRLQEHPDVTIMVEDASAAVKDPALKPDTYSAVDKSNFFWTQKYQRMKLSESLLGGSYNKVKIAGQYAVETMVRLVRDDGSEDFGYLVVARGDPDASVDTPDIMMYVIREGKNATRRGLAPIPKESFFTLAKAIASSVEHRDLREKR